MPLYGISPGACTENLIQAEMESFMPDGVSIRIQKQQEGGKKGEFLSRLNLKNAFTPK